MTTTVDSTQETCRTCSAPVIWCETETGKSMPVDVEPAAGGNIAIVERAGRRPLARVVERKHAFGRRDLHLSHFVTCPQASGWRNKKRNVA